MSKVLEAIEPVRCIDGYAEIYYRVPLYGVERWNNLWSVVCELLENQKAGL